MDDDVEVVDRAATLSEAAFIMRAAGVDGLPVVDDERLVGFITGRDIIERAVAEGLDASETRVREVMTHDVVFCREDDELEAGLRLLGEVGAPLVVVDRDDRVSGVLNSA
jgi:CBS domain-containing protein